MLTDKSWMRHFPQLLKASLISALWLKRSLQVDLGLDFENPRSQSSDLVNGVVLLQTLYEGSRRIKHVQTQMFQEYKTSIVES
ncbi:hypothetical protein B0J14DRAFT_608368 [Halenospora varia]|nr:hypothetical protein B0J14DRAFT_608368 [Halenospora varia]